ncbi:MAG TPA: hypothetical protein VIK56_00710 [Rhodoferax sp.]
MDTRTANIDVAAKIEEIKRFMPETYAAIKAKAGEIGNEAFVQVRRGLRGEANCFYAFEGGRVVGSPFNRTEIMAEIARYMVQFGCKHIVVWASEGVTDGAH